MTTAAAGQAIAYAETRGIDPRELVEALFGEAAMSERESEAQVAWLAYRDEYQRRNHLNARQAASQMRRREFIAGYLAALAEPQEPTP